MPVARAMIQRECPQCGSELVRTRRSDQQPGSIVVPAAASPGFRCSVCGGEFTAQQIRASKLAKSTTIEHV